MGSRVLDNRECLVLALFGITAFNQFANKGYYLCIEPVVEMPIYDDYYYTGNKIQVKDDNGNVIGEKDEQISTYTGARVYGTWYGWMQALNDYDTDGGAMYGGKVALANGFCLDDKDSIIYSNFGLTKKINNLHKNDEPTSFQRTDTDNRISYYNKYSTALNQSLMQTGSTSEGHGIHIVYGGKVDDSGTPINTYDVDDEPTKPADPEKPTDNNKTPQNPPEEGPNTGDVTIVKLYANIYRGADTDGDGKYTDEKITGIEQVGYFDESGCTNEIVITDERDITGYAVTSWSASCNKTSAYSKNYTVQEWLSDTAIGSATSLSLSFDRKAGATSCYSSSKGNLTSTYANPIVLNSNEQAIYVLYTKNLPAIDTWGDPTIPVNPPEDPDEPGDPKPGLLNIVKVYGEINTLNGSVIHVGTKYETNTTFNVHIQSERDYKLRSYYLCDGGTGVRPDTSYTATQWGDGTGGALQNTFYQI